MEMVGSVTPTISNNNRSTHTVKRIKVNFPLATIKAISMCGMQKIHNLNYTKHS